MARDQFPVQRVRSDWVAGYSVSGGPAVGAEAGTADPADAPTSYIASEEQPVQLVPDPGTVWAADSPYQAGDRIAAGGWVWAAGDDLTSGTVEPDWAGTIGGGGTNVDGWGLVGHVSEVPFADLEVTLQAFGGGGTPAPMETKLVVYFRIRG